MKCIDIHDVGGNFDQASGGSGNARMKPKKRTNKNVKKISGSSNPLDVQLKTLDQLLKNRKCTNDEECKDAVWHWLKNHNMFQYFLKESHEKSAEQIFSEAFMQVSAFCMNKGFCTTRPLTLPKFKQIWKKAIREFKKDASQPDPFSVF